MSISNTYAEQGHREEEQQVVGKNNEHVLKPLLTRVTEILHQQPCCSLQLCILGGSLSESLCNRAEDEGGLKICLQKLPSLFDISGELGKEIVTLNLKTLGDVSRPSEGKLSSVEVDNTSEDEESAWSRRAARRLERIQIYKAALEYKRYVKEVPPSRRRRTPDPCARVSNRKFDRALGDWELSWRLQKYLPLRNPNATTSEA